MAASGREQEGTDPGPGVPGMAGREILAKLQADIVGQKILELKSPEILHMSITAGRGRKVKMHMDHETESLGPFWTSTA